jgi:glycosyltransferase involved in cell wall biosynthesis
VFIYEGLEGRLRIGIVTEETWDFLHDIYADLCSHHQVSIFQRRVTGWIFFRERRARALFLKDLTSFMRQNDIVFFEWASELLVTASRLPKTCAIVTRLHRYEMYKWADQVNWGGVDKIILVSKAKQKEFIRKFPECAMKTVVVPPSVSLEKFSLQKKPYSGDLGILCHLTPRKRVYELILDFYELTKVNNGFRLHIGGDPHPSYGDYLESMQALVRELGLEDRVTFYGNVTDTPKWYRNIDIFVSNSYSEGLQVALLEAMASGCYCLSHRWAGAEELLPDDNLFYSGNDLREAILKFSKKTEEEQQVQKELMREIVAKTCSVDFVNNQIRQVLEGIHGVRPS